MDADPPPQGVKVARRNTDSKTALRDSAAVRAVAAEDGQMPRSLQDDGCEAGVHGLLHDGRDLEARFMDERLPAMWENARRWGAPFSKTATDFCRPPLFLIFKPASRLARADKAAATPRSRPRFGARFRGR